LIVAQQTRQSQNDSNHDERDNHADDNIKDTHPVSPDLHSTDFDIPLDVWQSDNHQRDHANQGKTADDSADSDGGRIIFISAAPFHSFISSF